jgi:hypothetical protein
MKKLLLAIFTLFAFQIYCEPAQWSTVSAEDAEMTQINKEIAKINNYFASMGAYSSSARTGAIFQYLKDKGTPASLKVLKQLIKSGDLPESFLNMV